jgi:hypothetical protein
MSEGRWPRRTLIRAIIACASAGLGFRLSPARAADKMTKARAEYQDKPNGIYSCGTCTLFEAPSFCKVVEGEVSKDGWCKAFAMAD